MKQQRAIAAPFQPPKASTTVVTPVQGNTATGTTAGSSGDDHIANPGIAMVASSSSGSHHSIEVPKPPQIIDFRNTKFPVLQPYNELTTKTYCGPTTESNWVIPGVLLVGAYPATQDDDETWVLISSILRLGIKKFVCLQQEYRHGVSEDMWRSGLALRPYFEDVKYMVENKDEFPHLKGHTIVQRDSLSFVHCPIVDCDVTDDHTVLNLCKQLVEDIHRGEVIYLHCWGGHGRTGTVVSIMLHMMYGLTAMEAMRRCQVVHDLRKCPVDVGSPQTQTQRDQVCRIVHHLIQGYKADRQGAIEAAESHAMDNHKKTGGIPRTMKIRSSFNTIYDHQQHTTTTTTTSPSLMSATVNPNTVKFPKFPHGNASSAAQESTSTTTTTISGKAKGTVTRNSFHTVTSTAKGGSSNPLASIVKEKAPTAPQAMLVKTKAPVGIDGKPSAAQAYKGHGHHIKPTSAENRQIRGSVLLNVQSEKVPPSSSILIPAIPNNSFAIGSQDAADFGSISMDIVDDGEILRMTENEMSDEAKGRPMSICMDNEVEDIQSAQNTAQPSPLPSKDTGTEDAIRPMSSTNSGNNNGTKKASQETSVRNALSVARQVLLGKSPSATSNEANKAYVAGETIPADSSKKKVPMPPSHAPPTTSIPKSGVATNRKLEKEMTSIM